MPKLTNATPQRFHQYGIFLRVRGGLLFFLLLEIPTTDSSSQGLGATDRSSAINRFTNIQLFLSSCPNRYKESLSRTKLILVTTHSTHISPQSIEIALQNGCFSLLPDLQECLGVRLLLGLLSGTAGWHISS